MKSSASIVRKFWQPGVRQKTSLNMLVCYGSIQTTNQAGASDWNVRIQCLHHRDSA